VRPKSLWPFCAVLGTPLPAIIHTRRIHGSPDDMISDTGQILYTTSPDKNHGVLLKIVTHARNIGGDLNPVRQPDPCHLSQGGVRFLWRRGIDTNTYPPLLRRTLKCARSDLLFWFAATFAYKLVNRRHGISFVQLNQRYITSRQIGKYRTRFYISSGLNCQGNFSLFQKN